MSVEHCALRQWQNRVKCIVLVVLNQQVKMWPQCLYIIIINIRDEHHWLYCEAKPVWNGVVRPSVCLHQQSLATVLRSIAGKLLKTQTSHAYTPWWALHCNPCRWPWPLTLPVSMSNANLHLGPLLENYWPFFNFSWGSSGARGPGFDSPPRHLNFQRLVISCFQVEIWLKDR